eukprot:278096-Pleurochrysis_carterae.AAC.3
MLRTPKPFTINLAATDVLHKLKYTSMVGMTGKKNAHKDNVQRRWDNRGLMQRMFQKWKKTTGYDNQGQKGKEEKGEKEGGQEKIYGIKHWGRFRRASDDYHLLADQNNPSNGCLRIPEAYIPTRGANTIPYHTS